MLKHLRSSELQCCMSLLEQKKRMQHSIPGVVSGGGAAMAVCPYGGSDGPPDGRAGARRRGKKRQLQQEHQTSGAERMRMTY